MRRQSTVSNRSDDDGMVAGINVTPLVDITLVVLVISMMATKIVVPHSLSMDFPRETPGGPRQRSCAGNGGRCAASTGAGETMSARHAYAAELCWQPPGGCPPPAAEAGVQQAGLGPRSQTGSPCRAMGGPPTPRARSSPLALGGDLCEHRRVTTPAELCGWLRGIAALNEQGCQARTYLAVELPPDPPRAAADLDGALLDALRAFYDTEELRLVRLDPWEPSVRSALAGWFFAEVRVPPNDVDRVRAHAVDAFLRALHECMGDGIHVLRVEGPGLTRGRTLFQDWAEAWVFRSAERVLLVQCGEND